MHYDFVNGDHGTDVDVLFEGGVTVGYFLEVRIHSDGLLLLILVLVPAMEGLSEPHNILKAKEYCE